MSKNSDTNNLLSSIMKLYSKLAIVIYEFRRNIYNKSSNTKNKSNIISELNEHVEELIANSVTETTSEIKDEITYSDFNRKSSITEHAGTKEDKSIHANNIENELSKYLKDNHKLSSTHPGIVDKLTKSIWDHIHTTLRAARSGNNEKAKLHMGIVEQGLDELSHYMQDDEYSQLVTFIEQYFIKIKNE